MAYRNGSRKPETLKVRPRSTTILAKFSVILFLLSIIMISMRTFFEENLGPEAASFISALLPLFIFQAFIVVPLALAREVANEAWKKALYLVAILALIPFFMYGAAYVNLLKSHQFLRELSAPAVSTIQVGGQTISDPEKLQIIVHALNHEEWLGRIGHKTVPDPLIITMKNGEVRRFQLSYALWRKGAVIDFSPPGDSFSLWYTGFAFCERLPHALKQAGIALPAEVSVNRQ